MEFPETVDLKLTSKCNHNCRYCYDSKEHLDMDFSELKKMFSLLSQKGVKSIVITGGEPLIRDDINQIFQEINNNHMKIYLDTNGDFFFKHKDSINRYVSILGLPLDFPSENRTYRSKDNFRNVLKILESYKKEKSLSIRVGTVVTKENINKLKEIAELLKNYPVDLWKIYQFIPIGPNGFANKDELNVETEEFTQAAEKVQEEYSKYFKILISKRKHRKCAYFFIGSNGTVFMPRDDKTNHGSLKIGNIFDKDILEKWAREVSIENYKDNIKKTFDYKLIS